MFATQAVARRFSLACLVALLIAALNLASADADPRGGADAYLKAVAQARTSDRIAALQTFVAGARGTALEVDALELLVWDRLRSGDAGGAAASARQLSGADADNALALAVLARTANPQPKTALETATRGLAQLARLRQPRGMAASEFATLKRQVGGMLNGAAGAAALQARDYGSARNYLRQAVAQFPNSSEYTYSLGVADLGGTQPNRNEAYWYLARAVILTRGTPASQQISQYAYDQYLTDGGTRENWSRFLVAANASSTAPAGPAEVRTVSTPAPTVTAGSATVRQPTDLPKRKNAETASAPRKRAVTAKKQEPAQQRKSATKKKPSAPDLGEVAEQADLARSAPPLPAPAPKLRPMPHPGAPISIGILIGASSGGKSGRKAMLDGLSEMVRHLRPGDEAFIMSFSDQLDFEQDLTGNYHLLEQAMDHIPPHSGSALYDAVAFAAGHLRRIARNGNRVLLVISDGRNGNSHTSPFQLAAEINGIRIECIGMDVGGADARYLLSALASHTGGQAQFVSEARQFPVITQEIAQALGLGGRF